MSRLSLNICPETDVALREVMEHRGVSMTEALRRLVGYGAVVFRAVGAGEEVLVRREGGELVRIVLVE